MNINDFTFGDTIAMTNKEGETKTGFILSYGFQTDAFGKLISGTENACLTKGTLMNPAKRDEEDFLWEEVFNGIKVEQTKEILFEKAFIPTIYNYSLLNDMGLC